MKRTIIWAILVALLTLFSRTSQAIPTDGLVAFYPFTGSANDASIYANHGTVYGAALAEDRFGNPNSTYLFDGLNDFIRIEASPTNSVFDEITISAWINITGNPQEIGGIVTRWNQHLTLGAYYHIAYDAIYEPGTIMGSSHEYYRITTDPPRSGTVSLNEWISVIYSISPLLGTENLYINGHIVDSKSSTEPIRDCDLPIIIGADIKTYQQNDYWRFFQGYIDDVLIYNRALSESEIQAIYNAPNPVPEPSTMILLGAGLIGFAGVRRKFRKS